MYRDDEFIGGELLNGKWMRQGNMKAVAVVPPYGDGMWQLFDVVSDPGETKDLSNEQPDVLRQLIDAWNQYAADVGIVLIDEQ